MKPFIGNKVYCSICKSNFNEFATFGSPVRNNARCHSCGSLERHRLIWKYINDTVPINTTKEALKILHFAPEKCLYDIFSNNKKIAYFPCDLFPEVYNFDGKVDILTIDITNINFNDNYFDIILCNHVLEHIEEDKKAMTELYRVMKKDGWGIFQVPIDYTRKNTYEDFTIVLPEEREKAFGQSDHVRWYGNDYKDRLNAVGFNVKEDNFVKKFSETECYKYGFMASEFIYYCTK